MVSNALCGLTEEDGYGTYTNEGIMRLCEGIKGSIITKLKCAKPKATRALPCNLAVPVSMLDPFD